MKKFNFKKFNFKELKKTLVAKGYTDTEINHIRKDMIYCYNHGEKRDFLAVIIPALLGENLVKKGSYCEAKRLLRLALRETVWSIPERLKVTQTGGSARMFAEIKFN